MEDDRLYGLSNIANEIKGTSYFASPTAQLSVDVVGYEGFESPWLSVSEPSVLSPAAQSDGHDHDHDDFASKFNEICVSVQGFRSSSIEDEESNVIRAKISSHPLYPKLFEAYIDFQKVGAAEETIKFLDEMLQEKKPIGSFNSSYCLCDDPELDEFMETYCNILAKYKVELGRTYDEATTFLKSMESQLNNLTRNDSKIPGFSLSSTTQ